MWKITSAVLCVIARIYVIQSIAGQDTLQLYLYIASLKRRFFANFSVLLETWDFLRTDIAAAVEVQNRV